MHTEGSGKLNISMQLVATSLDLVLNVFMNAPTTTGCGKIKDPTAQNALLSQWFWIFLPKFQALFLEYFTVCSTSFTSFTSVYFWNTSEIIKAWTFDANISTGHRCKINKQLMTTFWAPFCFHVAKITNVSQINQQCYSNNAQNVRRQTLPEIRNRLARLRLVVTRPHLHKRWQCLVPGCSPPVDLFTKQNDVIVTSLLS